LLAYFWPDKDRLAARDAAAAAFSGEILLADGPRGAAGIIGASVTGAISAAPGQRD
jgi:hypothetical protein